jgi:hypothetical protein
MKGRSSREPLTTGTIIRIATENVAISILTTYKHNQREKIINPKKKEYIRVTKKMMRCRDTVGGAGGRLTSKVVGSEDSEVRFTCLGGLIASAPSDKRVIMMGCGRFGELNRG